MPAVRPVSVTMFTPPTRTSPLCPPPWYTTETLSTAPSVLQLMVAVVAVTSTTLKVVTLPLLNLSLVMVWLPLRRFKAM